MGNRVQRYWYVPLGCTPPSLYLTCVGVVIFPEGGGQPCDLGTLTLKSASSPGAQSVQVIDAFRRKLEAVHIVRFPSLVDPTANGWAVGGEVHMEVDWRRRTYRKSSRIIMLLVLILFNRHATAYWPTRPFSRIRTRAPK